MRDKIQLNHVRNDLGHMKCSVCRSTMLWETGGFKEQITPLGLFMMYEFVGLCCNVNHKYTVSAKRNMSDPSFLDDMAIDTDFGSVSQLNALEGDKHAR